MRQNPITNWISFSTNLTFHLNATNGWHTVWVGSRGRVADGDQVWHSGRLYLDTVPPVIEITNPAPNSVTSKPYLQLKGLSDETLASIYFDVTNAAGVLTNEQGFPTDQQFDTNVFEFTTTAFQCFDIPLTNGDMNVSVMNGA